MRDKAVDASGFSVELGVDRTAALLIDRHGLHAFDFATQQAETLAAAGAPESALQWRAIATAIEREFAAKREPAPPANEV